MTADLIETVLAKIVAKTSLPDRLEGPNPTPTIEDRLLAQQFM